MTALATDRDTFQGQIARITRDVAAPHAEAVDRDARFPSEAVDALRELGALSAWVPTELGGAGLGLADIAGACRELARGCSATAMVFAMHQVQVATIARHLEPGSWHADYLTRLHEEQRLIASVTSEVGTGGNMGRSVAALASAGDGRVGFEKQATTISYGAHCDDLLTSLRRGPDADGGDQVLVLHAREDSVLTVTGDWDPLGMRGTCSPGFVLSAEIDARQVLGAPFRTMMVETIVPVSHILWSNLWLGIGLEAFTRGRQFVRAAARRAAGQPVPAARRLSDILLELRLIRAEVDQGLVDFTLWDASPDRAALDTVAAELRFNGLKVSVSERVPMICQAVLAAVGIDAYRNDSPFSVGRLLRDSLSGQLMVANDRIATTNANLVLVAKGV